MPKTRPPYPAAFRQQMVELVRLAKPRRDFAFEFRQRPGVPLFQLLQARRERLRHPPHLAVDGVADAGEPLVVHRERPDLGVGERGVAVEHLPVQRGADGGAGGGVHQREAARQDGAVRPGRPDRRARPARPGAPGGVPARRPG